MASEKDICNWAPLGPLEHQGSGANPVPKPPARLGGQQMKRFLWTLGVSGRILIHRRQEAAYEST